MIKYRVMIPHEKGWWGGTVVAVNEREAMASALFQYNAAMVRYGKGKTLDVLPVGTQCSVVHP